MSSVTWQSSQGIMSPQLLIKISHQASGWSYSLMLSLLAIPITCIWFLIHKFRNILTIYAAWWAQKNLLHCLISKFHNWNLLHLGIEAILWVYFKCFLVQLSSLWLFCPWTSVIIAPKFHVFSCISHVYFLIQVTERQNRNGKNRPAAFLAKRNRVAHINTTEINAFITDILQLLWWPPSAEGKLEKMAFQTLHKKLLISLAKIHLISHSFKKKLLS